MALIFLLTQRTRTGGPSRYLEHVRTVHWKFSRGIWKKVSTQNMRLCQNIPTWFWASFFQNLNTFGFSWHIFWSVSRAVTILLLMQRSRLGGPFRYLEHVRKIHRKFSRGLWKKFELKTWGRDQAENEIRIFWQNLIFWTKTFFQRLVENFPWTLRTCSRYLKGPLNLALCASKKS